MTTSYNGKRDNSQKRNNNSERYVVRHYPGADYATTQFVDKLRHRSAESQSLSKVTSSDLMKDVYKTVPVQQMNRMPAANVNEIVPGYDAKYSQYSTVNVNAMKEAKKREEMARRSVGANGIVQNARVNNTMGNPNARRPAASPARRPAASTPRQNVNGQQNPTVKTAQPVRGENRRPVKSTAAVPVKRQAPVKAVEPVNVRFRSPDASGQIAESGPREALYKKIPFPKIAVVILLLSLIFFLMVHSIVKNFEYQREISDLESQIEVLNVRAAELKLELEARDDIAEIERRAEEIGMIKSGKVEEKYISLDNSEIIENFTRDEDGYGSFTTMLSAVSRQLSKFLGGE